MTTRRLSDVPYHKHPDHPVADHCAVTGHTRREVHLDYSPSDTTLSLDDVPTPPQIDKSTTAIASKSALTGIPGRTIDSFDPATDKSDPATLPMILTLRYLTGSQYRAGRLRHDLSLPDWNNSRDPLIVPQRRADLPPFG